MKEELITRSDGEMRKLRSYCNPDGTISIITWWPHQFQREDEIVMIENDDLEYLARRINELKRDLAKERQISQDLAMEINSFGKIGSITKYGMGTLEKHKQTKVFNWGDSNPKVRIYWLDNGGYEIRDYWPHGYTFPEEDLEIVEIEMMDIKFLVEYIDLWREVVGDKKEIIQKLRTDILRLEISNRTLAKEIASIEESGDYSYGYQNGYEYALAIGERVGKMPSADSYNECGAEYVIHMEGCWPDVKVCVLAKDHLCEHTDASGGQWGLNYEKDK